MSDTNTTTTEETLVSLKIGPIEIVSPRGVEVSLPGGIEIHFLTGAEASATAFDIIKALALFDAVTGEPLAT